MSDNGDVNKRSGAVLIKHKVLAGVCIPVVHNSGEAWNCLLNANLGGAVRV